MEFCLQLHADHRMKFFENMERNLVCLLGGLLLASLYIALSLLSISVLIAARGGKLNS